MTLIAALALAAPAFEARILWVDASANLSWTTQPEKVAEFCARVKKAGFNELVVDVKPINGKLLIAAPPEERLASFRNIDVPRDYDVLAEFVKGARANGLRISAGINVLSEGHSRFPGVGKAYENPEWQIQVATPYYEAVQESGATFPIILDPKATLKPGQMKLSNGPNAFRLPGLETKVEFAGETPKLKGVRGTMKIVPQTEALPNLIGVFVDPLQKGVRERLMQIVRDLARYDIDGIVFDRLRYPSVTAGFSREMQAEFEKRYGPVSFWPDSVFRANPDPGAPLIKGRRFSEWMQFRVEIVTELLRDLRAAIKQINPRIAVGCYVGLDWETYYEVGVNFSEDAAVGRYPWARPEYGLAGYAAYTDFLMPGCFYKVAREVDPAVAPGRERFTVEGGAKLAKELVGKATFVYPSLYGLDWEKNPDGLRAAIKACRENGSGIMFFDASYVIGNDWWPIFEAEFASAPPLPPHAMPSLRPGNQNTR